MRSLTLPCPAPNLRTHVRTHRAIRASGRSAASDCEVDGGNFFWGAASNAARRDRLRQNLHGRERDQEREQADAGHLAQQDAGGAALRGVQRVLSQERRRVFRQLL